MGVKSCYRMYCESIMVDTYVDGIGYVCNSCQEEFKSYLQQTGENPTTESEIRSLLGIFIETQKNNYSNSQREMDIDSFFKQYTEDYGEEEI